MTKRRARVIEYTPSVDDHAALTVLLWDRDGRADGVQLRFWLVGLVMCAAVGAIAFLIIKDFGSGSALGVLAVPLLVTAWTAMYLLVPRIRDGVVWESARKHSARVFIPRGPGRVWLDREGLHTEGAGGHKVMTPRRFREVVETSDHVFLFVSPTQAIAVPKRAAPAEVKWLAAAIRAARARFDPPNSTTIQTLDLVLTFEDYLAIERAPGATRPGDKALNRYRMRRLLPVTAVMFLVMAAIERATDTPPLRAAVPAIAFAGLVGAAIWVVVGKQLRALRIRRARVAYERSGDRLRLCIEPDGVRGTTQDGSGLNRWADLTLDQTTDHYYLHTGSRTAVVIPRRSGPEVESFAALIRPRIQAAANTSVL